MMPKSVVLMLLALRVLDGSYVPNRCKNIPKDEWFAYDKQTIATISGTAMDIVKSPMTGKNYYVLSTESGEMDLYVLTPHSNNPRKLLENIQTVAVDELTNTIYIGSENGLKIYDEDTGEVTNVYNITDDILKLFIAKGKSALYAVIRPDKVVKYEGINLKGVELQFDSPKGMNIAVDNDGNSFVLNQEIIPEVWLKGYSESIKYVGIETNTVNILAVGLGNRVFAAAKERLFILPTDNVIAKLIVTLDFDPLSLFIDGEGGMTFGTINAIVSLIFKYTECINDILG